MENYTCYYFDEINRIKDFDYNKISIDEKPKIF